MARFTAVRDVRAPAPAVWDALVDWPRHGDWVPLTVVRILTVRPGGVGARFVGRTGAGPLAFDDPMEVTAWQPPEGDRPGRCDVVKQGRVIGGSAWFSVAPLAAGRCRVAWHEDVTVTPHAVDTDGARVEVV